MTSHPDLFAALAAPFEQHELKDRPQQGRKLIYVTARTVMNRLDTVLGPEHWWDEYTPAENSVLCRLTIRLPDGSTLTKCDAGGYAGMADSGDDDKSGYSDAFKRAAVKFGVARYLYRDGVPSFAQDATPAPEAPPVEQPRERRPHANGATASANGNGNGNGKQHHEWTGAKGADVATAPRPREQSDAPRTGKALFAWTKDMEAKHQVNLLKYLNGWAKIQEYPARMVEWDADQVRTCHTEALRKLATLGSNHGDAYEEALGG